MDAEAGRQQEVRRLAAELYRERRRDLTAIAHRHARNDADAQEALQEAFVNFVRRFDPAGTAPALPWLILTLKRECWRRRRDAHLDRYVGQEADPDTGEVGVVLAWIPSPGAGLEERVAERDEARRRLADLKPDQRTGLGLLGAGFSYREIAALKQWTYSKVNRCVTEGRAALTTA